MTDQPAAGGTTAGRLLRQAREAQGLHIAALAAAIKVAPRKLDALENDRWSELPDATFTRALAQTVCRTLKIDSRPVLQLLPPAPSSSLERANGGLNTPFRPRGSRDDAGIATAAIRPMVWAALLLMAAAVAVYLLPERLLGSRTPAGTAAAPDAPPLAASAASAASAAMAASGAWSDPAAVALPHEAPASAAVAAPFVATVSTPVTAVATTPQPAAAPAPAASEPAAPRLLQLHTTQASWVELRDGRGQLLLSRTVQPGEDLGFDAGPPLRLTVGNAAATRVTFRGRPVDLTANARDKNVARLQLE